MQNAMNLDWNPKTEKSLFTVAFGYFNLRQCMRPVHIEGVISEGNWKLAS